MQCCRIIYPSQYKFRIIYALWTRNRSSIDQSIHGTGYNPHINGLDYCKREKGDRGRKIYRNHQRATIYSIENKKSFINESMKMMQKLCPYKKRRPSVIRRTPEFSGNRTDCQFEQRSAQTLGLVTQTLLVTVLTHALAALMLVDFCFTAFFERSHDCGSFVVLLW